MSNKESKSNIDEQPISLAEHMSTVLDDEAGSFEQRRVLDELTSADEPSEALSQKLSHYALIGESMRSTNPVTIAGPSFLAGIHEQIEAEDEYHDVQVADLTSSSANDATNPQASNKSSFRPLGGFALAASFAAMAVMGVQNYQLSNQVDEQSAIIISAAKTLQDETQMALATNPEAMIVADKKQSASKQISKQEYRLANLHARSFLKRYVDSHVQYASRSTFVPSVRSIAYADY